MTHAISTEAVTTTSAPERTANRRRRPIWPLLTIGISAGAAALAIVAIATDDVGSQPGRPATVPAVQSAVVEPVPDGVPCPDSPIRGQTTC